MTMRVKLSLLLVLLGQADAGNSDTEQNLCGVYLAESSVKNAGWGVFAGRDFDLGAAMGTKGIGVPVTDLPNTKDGGSLSGFLWKPALVGGFGEAKNVQMILPGIAMMINHYPSLANCFESGLSYRSLMKRSSDPMAGSSTPYHGLDFLASKKISAGQELFVDSKQDWVEKSELPHAQEYNKGSEIINALLDYHGKHPDLSEEQWIDILYRMRTEMLAHKPNVARLIPKTLKLLIQVNDTTVYKTNITDRSFEWLKENGKCLDNIQEGVSTISGAGRGAFATRYLPEGTIVSPAPLVHIMDRSLLQTASESNSTQQLLLNYCFGHQKSQILLCPTTHVTLINHDTQRANVKIRWGEPSTNRYNADVDNRAEGLDDMENDNEHHLSLSSKLSFDFVATTDIHPGQEIFLNYGKEWEDAFLAHTSQWRPPESSLTYVPSNDLNERNEPLLLSNDTRMIHSSYECRLEPFAREDTRHSSVVEDYGANPSVHAENWSEQLTLLAKNNEYLIWHPCEVYDTDDDDCYKIRVYSKSLPQQILMKALGGVPRSAIRYADRAYHSDQHLAASFRHYIPIPDSMFPLRWRNDYKSAKEFNLGKPNDGQDVSLEGFAHLKDEYEQTLRAVKCGIYFAPSNIPHAGFGTYTTVPIQGKGIMIGTELPAVVFPRPNSAQAIGIWDGNDYIWSAKAYHAEYETYGNSLGPSVMAVNDGALANFHPGLVNEYLEGSTWDPMLDRCIDSGAGAFSDYIHYSFRSSFEIGAGEELFVSYGEQWFSSRPMFNEVALLGHYNEANNMLSSIWSMVSIPDAGLSQVQVEDILKLTKLSIVEVHQTKVALRHVNTLDDIQHVVHRNGTAQSTVEQRSLEWLETNGQCIDHIYVKDSTVRQAGKGAFSRRLLETGTTIISAPLMATWGQHMFEMNTDEIHYLEIEDINNISLFLNYQFSHPDSSVYFFPINQVIAINHNSNRTKTGKMPNARLRWATWNRKSAYFLARPLEDLRSEHYSTMVLDVVATQDIHPDEEVFIDYGEEWETKWNKHVQDYGSPCKTEGNRKTSKEIAAMNGDKFNTDHHAWSNDHFTVCKERGIIDTDTMWIVANKEEALRDPEIIGDFTVPVLESLSSITWNHIGFNLTQVDSTLLRFPCMIVGVNSGAFDVLYFLPDRKIADAGKLYEVNNLPPGDIEFIPMPLRSDTFHKKSFRHPIKIPDEIFPLHWKDVPRD